MHHEVRPDPRNVDDKYKYWSEDAIKADMREKCHNFSVLISNKTKDFNMGTVIRNANAFLAKEVIIYGSKQYDRRGTVGAHLYTNLRHVKYTDELNLEGLVVGIDNIKRAEPMESFQWPKDQHVTMVFGEEQGGLLAEFLEICEKVVYINQYGSVRSLNVGVASGVAMYDYCRKIVD